MGGYYSTIAELDDGFGDSESRPTNCAWGYVYDSSCSVPIYPIDQAVVYDPQRNTLRADNKIKMIRYYSNNLSKHELFCSLHTTTYTCMLQFIIRLLAV